MKIAIVIPARYGSTRFPGKPLARIAGKTMLARVVETARKAAATAPGEIDVLVATEDTRIADHCQTLDVPAVITSENCATGSDRVLEAITLSGLSPDFIINFQGDTPFTPPEVLTSLIERIRQEGKKLEVITPCHRLSWDELDQLRENKKNTPFSGTTLIRAPKTDQALWFSKNIIPAIRKEDKWRTEDDISPILQHIGIYGFRRDILEQFVALPPGYYETLEGLEQLRLLENGYAITTTEISFSGTQWKKLQGGIDSPEDLQRAEALLSEQEKGD